MVGADETPDSSNAGFPKDCRLLTTPEFKQVFDFRCSAADDTLIVYARANGASKSRLGLSVSRKVGNAVCRNQWKRRVRESFRRRHHQLPQGFDFVVIPRKGASPAWAGIDAAVARVFPRSAQKADRKRGER